MSYDKKQTDKGKPVSKIYLAKLPGYVNAFLAGRQVSGQR
jgi:hypothetical protein